MERVDECEQRMVENTQVDRISTLPDSILHEIFSSVDIKHLVQTSVLARRWRNIWASHPYLNLVFPKIVTAEEGDSDAQVRAYENFIRRFLSLRDQSCNITKSSISLHFAATPDFLDECISYLVEHNVEKLHIHAISCCSETLYKFPPCFYTCHPLTELDLIHNPDVAVPDAPLALPLLTKLRLHGFTFWDDKVDDDESDVPRDKCITKEFFSSCVSLECLVLDRCDFYHLDVSLPLLKRLDVKFMSIFTPDGDIVLKLDTPLLNSFKLEGGASVHLSVKSKLSCIEKVHIHLFLDTLAWYNHSVKEAVVLNLIEMLEQLGNASTVTLTEQTAEILEMDLVSIMRYPSPFHGLKHLKILETRGYGIIHPKVLKYLTAGSPYHDSVVKELTEDRQKAVILAKAKNNQEWR